MTRPIYETWLPDGSGNNLLQIELWSSAHTGPPDRSAGCASSSIWLRALGLWWPIEQRSAFKAKQMIACCTSFRDLVETAICDWPLQPVEPAGEGR